MWLARVGFVFVPSTCSFNASDCLLQSAGPCLTVNRSVFNLLTTQGRHHFKIITVVTLSLMASQQTGITPPPKRRKLDDDASNQEVAEPAVHASLNKPISPPLSRRKSPEPPSFTPTWNFDSIPEQTLASRPVGLTTNQPPDNESSRKEETRFLPSPIQLTKIEKLSAHQNVDAVSLSDLLGDPLIKECWNFNFLFDLDFVM
jgi:tyrosyl-DNA phosphodiesterase-1